MNGVRDFGGIGCLLCGLALLGVAGCATDPRLDETGTVATSSDEPPVLVDDGRRVANPGEYQALLENDAPEADTQVMLDQLLGVTQQTSGSALVADNDVSLLIDGPATFERMFEDIEQARDSIHLETFILEDNEIGQALAQRLIASRQRGVKVRALIDSVGSLELPGSFIERLRDQGIELRLFHPINPIEDPRIWRSNNRNHRKLLVIDGRIAYSGGINFSDVYAEGSFSASPGPERSDEAWRDTHLRIVGPVVQMFQRQFLKMWNKDQPEQEQLGGPDLFPPLNSRGDMMVGVISSSGGDDDEFDIYTVLAAAISHAQKRVWITQAYFAPDEAFLDTLKDASRRGADVRLLLPGVTDVPLLRQASRSSYDELLQAGIRIFERQGSTLHAKTIVVDSVWASIGSANLDYRSFVLNFELNTVIVSRDFGRAMDKLFLVDLQQADEIRLEDWRRRSLLQRLKETLGDMLRRWL